MKLISLANRIYSSDYCLNLTQDSKSKSAESVSFIEKSEQSLWPFHYWINGYSLLPQKKKIVMDDSTIMIQKVRQFKKNATTKCAESRFKVF